MGKVKKEEIVQWASEITSLGLEWTKITRRIRQRGENVDYREVIGEDELPLLLEKLKKVPVPKEELCESFRQHCEKTLRQLIEDRAKYVCDPNRPRISRVSLLPAFVVVGPFHFLKECLEILAKKYQI